MKPIRHVYVAGAYTAPNLAGIDRNCAVAVMAGDRLLVAGYVPLIPHLFRAWDVAHPHGYEDWMRLCLAWLERCDALVRLPGPSAGADREVAHARALGLPIYFGVEEFLFGAAGRGARMDGETT